MKRSIYSIKVMFGKDEATSSYELVMGIMQHFVNVISINLFRINTPRKQGGLGNMDIPLLADKNCEIAKAYGVYKEDDGVAFR